MRSRGRIEESLTLFQAATCLNPQNPANLKQVGRCLFLLGKHKFALEVYDEVQKVSARETVVLLLYIAAVVSRLHQRRPIPIHPSHSAEFLL